MDENCMYIKIGVNIHKLIDFTLKISLQKKDISFA